MSFITPNPNNGGNPFLPPGPASSPGLPANNVGANGDVNLAQYQALIQESIEKINQFLPQINQFSNMANDVILNSALSQAKNGYMMGLLEAQGIEAQLQINNITTAYNVQSDLTQLTSRNALMLASKAYESATLVAQFREKIFGMFISITEQRTNSTWGRIKQLTQGFKF